MANGSFQPTTADLDERIRGEIGEELRPLLEMGFAVTSSMYSETAFGDFYVDLRRGADELRIIRDRNEYMLRGDEADLKRAGLWRVFDSKAEFFTVLTRYVTGGDE